MTLSHRNLENFFFSFLLFWSQTIHPADLQPYFTQPIVETSPVYMHPWIPSCTGLEATTLKNSVLCVANQNMNKNTYFSTRSPQMFSSCKTWWESNSLNHGKLVPFFLALIADSLYHSAYTRNDLKLLSRSAESPKYLLAVRVVTSNMGMHIGQILSQYVQWMKTFWRPSAKSIHCKEIIIPDELCVQTWPITAVLNIWHWIFGCSHDFRNSCFDSLEARAYLPKAANSTYPQDPPTFRSANSVNDPSLQSCERSEALP